MEMELLHQELQSVHPAVQVLRQVQGEEHLHVSVVALALWPFQV